MLPKRIEEASLNAWPALQHILFDGWILRFARGYTRRANSVNPFYPSSLDVQEKIDVCENLYREKDLPPVFRLTPFSSPPGLDQALDSRGYRKTDPTLVLFLDLRNHEIKPASSCELRTEGLEAWMDIFCRFRQVPVGEHQTHQEMLGAIPSQRFLVCLADSGRPVACGLAVLEERYLGLFDLITNPQHRNKGYGTQLVSGLLSYAQKQGAWYAYLQVMSVNQPARHLYARFGFEEAYHYWYRITDV